MRCDVVQGLFSEIYDGVAEHQAVLAKHVKDCPVCAEEYKSYSQMLDELKLLPEPELPFGFHEMAMAKVQALVPPNDHTIDDCWKK